MNFENSQFTIHNSQFTIHTMAYDHQTLEQKWQKFWEENKTFKTENPISIDSTLLSFSEGESAPKGSSLRKDDKKNTSGLSV